MRTNKCFSLIGRLSLLMLIMMVALIPFSCKSGGEKGSESGAPIEIKLNFRNGDKYTYTSTISQKITTMGMTVDQDMTMEMLYETTGMDGADKKMTITYSAIRFKNTTPVGSLEYDSKAAGKHTGPMAFMDSLIGKSFTMIVGPDGSIKNVEGLGSLESSLGASGAGVVSDTAIRMMMQNSFDMYPGKPVKVGDSWVKKSEMSFSQFKIDTENTYTLKEVKGNIATIAVSSLLSLPKSETSQQGVKMQMEMNGKQEGTLDVDIQTGQMISGTTEQNISGKINAAGQEMPMEIKGTVKVSSKKS